MMRRIQSTVVAVIWGMVVLLALATNVDAQITGPAIIRGNKIFNSVTGEYIPIKGIDYYPRPNDGPLTQSASIDFFNTTYAERWQADIANFQELGVNVVRLYAVAPGVNHDPFMAALADAGIYALISLVADCEDCAIREASPPDCYPAQLKDRGQFIIGEFAKYDNVLGFSAGNEVNLISPDQTPQTIGPCQKAFIRDMRAYIRGCSNIRQIPVGLEIADVDRAANAVYYACRENGNELENAEYYGINTYLHCDASATDALALPGYQALLADLQNYSLPIPVLLTEFGCINESYENNQRTWLEVDTIFSSQYRQELAGGCVFEYSTELTNAGGASNYPFSSYHDGNYGLGYFSPVDCNSIDIPCTYNKFDQFGTLADKFASVDVSDEPSLSEYTSSGRAYPECPTGFASLSSFDWPADAEPDRECPYGGGWVPTPSSGAGTSTAPAASPATTRSPSSSDYPSATPSKSPVPTWSHAPSPLPSSVPTIPTNTLGTDDESPLPTTDPAFWTDSGVGRGGAAASTLCVLLRLAATLTVLAYLGGEAFIW